MHFARSIVLGYYSIPTSTSSTSTLFHKTIGYNRLTRKIAMANLGGPVKRKNKLKGKERKGKGRKNYNFKLQ